MAGTRPRRCPQKRTDYLFPYTSDVPIAVVKD
jgi:hypothetical protein